MSYYICMWMYSISIDNICRYIFDLKHFNVYYIFPIAGVAFYFPGSTTTHPGRRSGTRYNPAGRLQHATLSTHFATVGYQSEEDEETRSAETVFDEVVYCVSIC